MTRRQIAASLVAGLLWGLVAWTLARRAFPTGVWAGVVFAPFIGLLVGIMVQPSFQARNGFGRSIAALIGLYLGATLFSMAIALASGPQFRSRPIETLTETVLATWWGITITGFILFLWPLAYFTHWVIEARE